MFNMKSVRSVALTIRNLNECHTDGQWKRKSNYFIVPVRLAFEDHLFFRSIKILEVKKN